MKSAFKPLQIFFGVTYNCNLNCRHCYVKKDNRKEHSSKVIKKILKNLAAMGVVKIIFSHGESLLRKDFPDILDFCKKIDLDTTLLSNGLILDDRVAKKIKKAGVSKVLISLDSLKKEAHNNLRRHPGAWDGAMNAFKICGQNGVRFGINTTINESNYQDLDKFVQLALDLGAREIDFLFIRPKSHGEYKKEKFLDKNYASIVRKIWQLKQKNKKNLIIGFHDPLAIAILKPDLTKKQLSEVIQENKCQVGRAWASIQPSGDVYPCNFLPILAGNVYKDSLPEIWKNLERIGRINRSISDKCKKCKVSADCRGGCKAFSFASNNLNNGDPRCIGGINEIFKNQI